MDDQWPVVHSGLRENWWLHRSERFTVSHLPFRVCETGEMNTDGDKDEASEKDWEGVLSLFAFVGGNTITAWGSLLLLRWVFKAAASISVKIGSDNKFIHRLNLISFERGEWGGTHYSCFLSAFVWPWCFVIGKTLRITVTVTLWSHSRSFVMDVDSYSDQKVTLRYFYFSQMVKISLHLKLFWFCFNKHFTWNPLCSVLWFKSHAFVQHRLYKLRFGAQQHTLSLMTGLSLSNYGLL